ncbi:MAG: hypothetical protein AAF198_13645 [Pseudomonadota bacterium]
MTGDEATRLYNELGVLIANTPDLISPELPEVQVWLGRVYAILEEALNIDIDVISFRTHVDNLKNTALSDGANTAILTTLHRTMAKLERQMPAQATSSFIGTGEAFSALTSIQKIIAQAQSSIMFVDPYAAANLLSDYAILAAEGVQVNVLAADKRVKPDLLPALKAWKTQYTSRPLELRLASPTDLHDRAIFVDEKEAWTLGTSFNGIGKSRPTTLQKVDPKEVFPDKLNAYNSIWSSAKVEG